MTYHPNYQPTPLGGPPPKKRRVGLWIALGVGVALVLFLCAVLALAPRNKPHAAATVDLPAEQQTTSAAAPAKAPAKPKAVTIGAGTWEVGTEVKPGTYTTTAQDSCYWARLKSFDGDLNSIITNGNLDAGEHGRITVKASDKGLDLSGDCTWKRAS